MKLLKLNKNGIAHYFIPLVIVVALGIGGTAYLVSSHADTPETIVHTCNYYTVGVGSQRPNCVKAIQFMLNGYNTFYTQFRNDKPPAYILKVDGIYGGSTGATNGNSTEDQVIRWQRISGLTTVDGVVGHDTWAKLCYWGQRMSNSWNQSHPSTAPPTYMVSAINSANNVGCLPKIAIPK